MKVLAKAALKHDQIKTKIDIGCDGIEIQLLNELVAGLHDYRQPAEVWNLAEFKDYPIMAVHAPLLSSIGLSDTNIEFCYKNGVSLLEYVFQVANYFGEVRDSRIPIIVHTQVTMFSLCSNGNVWDTIVSSIGYLLDKYPHTELIIENVTPIRDSHKSEIYLGAGFKYDNVIMAGDLRDKLKTDRVGTCLDVCHASITKMYMEHIYDLFRPTQRESYEIEDYFNANKEVCKIIHLAGFKGNGYGKGRHATAITSPDDETLKQTIKCYKKFEYTCPITIETNDLDLSICEEYKATKESLRGGLLKW